jgi:hypothetical protein
VNLKTFDDIKFPFFGLYKKPEKISFTIDKIFINKTLSSHKETVDDKSLTGDYFARLLQLDKRIKFDCTCKDLQQLVFQRPTWGMDANAKPFDLSERSYHASIKRKVVKTIDNLIWVNKISYPFNVPTQEELSLDIESLYAVMVSINNEWYIKQFTMDDKDVNVRKKILL